MLLSFFALHENHFWDRFKLKRDLTKATTKQIGFRFPRKKRLIVRALIGEETSLKCKAKLRMRCMELEIADRQGFLA
jgi:hypothetical protein